MNSLKHFPFPCTYMNVSMFLFICVCHALDLFNGKKKTEMATFDVTSTSIKKTYWLFIDICFASKWYRIDKNPYGKSRKKSCSWLFAYEIERLDTADEWQWWVSQLFAHIGKKRKIICPYSHRGDTDKIFTIFPHVFSCHFVTLVTFWKTFMLHIIRCFDVNTVNLTFLKKFQRLHLSFIEVHIIALTYTHIPTPPPLPSFLSLQRISKHTFARTPHLI